MKYRAEIDGLRALAVLPVILFHAGFEWFSGGFVGVDVFFVISGYLITTIIISEMAEKKFSIVNFYERRARRILPALYFLLIFATIYALLSSPIYARDIFQSILATTFFAENILLYIESSDYFDGVVGKKLLFHTWSLGVEEQYYIFFPIFIILFWSFGKKNLVWIISLLTVASFILSEWGWRNEPIANFYLAPTRAWELFAGSLVAFYLNKTSQQSNQLKSFAGILLIAFAIHFYDESTPFPSIYTLVPVIGAALIIIFGDSKTLVAKLLSNKYLVGIGLVSFSAYLWHQPIFTLYHREMGDYLNLYLNIDWRPFLILLILCISTFSYFVIEKPFRYQVPKKIFIFTFIFITIFLTGTSYYGHITKGFEKNKIELFSKDKSLYIDHFVEVQRAISLWSDDYSPNSKLLVVGDSMAADLKAALDTQNLVVNKLALEGACSSALIQNSHGCSVSIRDVKDLISPYEYIFITFDFVEENSIRDIFLLRDILADTSKKIFVVISPRFKRAASDLSYKFATSADINQTSIKSIYFNSLSPKVKEIQAFALERNSTFVIDKVSYFCDNGLQECKFYNENGKALFYDELHLTEEGLNLYGKKFVKTLCKIDPLFCE
ncbi:acyltransferase [Gammaproteobacteria bacterium]|nr:acyltransferase [Gammaproteobacteria bacterium]